MVDEVDQRGRGATCCAGHCHKRPRTGGTTPPGSVVLDSKFVPQARRRSRRQLVMLTVPTASDVGLIRCTWRWWRERDNTRLPLPRLSPSSTSSRN